MKTSIRPRRDEDIDRCVSVLERVHAVDGYPMQWPANPREWLAPERLLAAWVAEDADGAVGHVAVHSGEGDPAASHWTERLGRPLEQIAVLAQLFVSPNARGHGLGATLVAHACDEARARGLFPALNVLDHDRAAIQLYEHAGWYRVASTPAPWGRELGEPQLLHYYLAPDS